MCAYKRAARLGFLISILWSIAASASAQTSVQPYFLLIVDTSGSMTSSTGGTNSCGQTATRMTDAKCVIQNVVNGYGEINFGLERFENSCSGSCSATCTSSCGCSCTRTCDDTAASGEVLVPITPGNQSDILRWNDYTCGTCSTAVGSNPELSAAGLTPLAGSLRAARQYYEGGGAFPSPIAGDSFSACRPYAVILLTDGAETCGGTPATAAAELRTTMVGGTPYDVRTYVIGFGISPGDADIEAIATAGGTDAPGGTRGFYASDETSLSLAFSQIITDSILYETCNSADDDCDGLVDEGFTLYCDRPGGVAPPPTLCVDPGETVCDGIDDNCDGSVDEGLLNACGTCGAPPTEICDAADNDCDGIIDEGGVCGGCTPTAEICDNIDNDCDGTTDESLSRPCGTDTGVCAAGTQSCSAGTWGACSGTGPSAEACDGLDNDCDGVIDGMSRPCGSSTGACSPGDQVCTIGAWGSCIGGVGPASETCNGADDDCDASTDEGDPGGGAACGSSTGACTAGTVACVGGALTCTGGVSPSAETCDGVDEDCDGSVDEGVPSAGSCGSSTGQCDPGALTCVAGAFVCTGGTGPAAEACNGLDDDCDGSTDEGDPGGGAACGSSTGACMAGTVACVGGALTCAGGVSASPETCDGVDEDCDGSVDEGVPSSGSCGSSTGQCDPGALTCVAGAFVCTGGTGPAAETCNALDDDCDGSTDEGDPGGGAACGSSTGACMPGAIACVGGALTCTGGVSPGAETCDGVDEDCDGLTDEGVGSAGPCGTATGQCDLGALVCTGGAFVCTGGTGPSAETCNGLDDDCNGLTDEGDPGGGAACGTAIGACTPGTLSCVAGALTCTGGVRPSPETCDGTDEDCDGTVDDGVPTDGPCGSAVGECSEGARTCVGGAYVCVGDRGPATELCDSRDNDCDGTTDEGNPGGGAACGSATGECMPGTSVCTGGTLVCTGGVTPTAEACDALDNDCDGLIDEGNPSGGAACGATDVGTCEFGAEACVMGAIACVGETGPGAEICDGLDNDCDALTDEGNPEGGAACGDDTGECMAGITMCTAGMLACTGAVGPTPEVCDGLDNDCDGVVDDGIAVGAPCGSDVGECAPGRNVCRAGGLVCEGETGPIGELCDLLDNDCDAMIDEGLGLGTACGTDVGVCTSGSLMCVDGTETCVGGTPPGRETCDCEDDDCDGTTDEAPTTGDLCPAGSTCIDCSCALPCMTGEFGFTCPGGRVPVEQMDGSCFCVAERCNDETCAADTIERDGAVVCGPGMADAPECVCKSNTCTFPCDGTICEAGTVCEPNTGLCVEDSCRGLGCPDDEICDLDTGECGTDPCAMAMCPADQACRDGVCEGSCATVDCVPGERCAAGVCVADLCATSSCTAVETCDPSDGSCVPDLCAMVTCAAGTVCDPLTGDCGADPCLALTCPEMQHCVEGECVADAPPMMEDAGTTPMEFDAGPETPEDPATRVLATGGCACNVAGGRTSTPPLGGLLLLLGLAGWALRRRRRALLALLGALGLLVLASGCEVEPYCLDGCDEAGIPDAGTDGGMDASDAMIDAGEDAGSDAGPDGCLDMEICNAVDDDCDGMVDEGIDTETDSANCGGCGIICAPAHAFGECVAGACEVTGCDVEWLDLNMDPSDGCEYRCLATAADDVLCDLRDNDCDGATDEDVDLDADPSNCGSCGRTCRFAHAAGACTAGACTLGACDADFYDLDGMAGNGCEYACMIASPADEVCNVRDDDCDGMVDEGDPGGGGTCGSAVGACSAGIEACTGGAITCVGETVPTTELCNGADDDCDGSTDEGDPEGGRLCGTGTGTCSQGREVCTGGALVCTGGTGPVAETCDGLDNDCDGMIDEGDPDGGASCGSSVGSCMSGTEHCRGGVVACEMAGGPMTEVCDGLDNNCDGTVDEGNPGGGGSCGTDVGACTPGSRICTGGALVCVGEVGPGVETCNSLDDNCDGTVDEGNPGGGAACGTTTGTCTAGAETCVAGALVCIGGAGPVAETCDGLDNDCDGMADEGNPDGGGSCGTGIGLCTFGTRICTAGALVCTGGTGPAVEVCNALDDDCDGLIDEGDPGGGAACGTTTGTCTAGAQSCVGGALTCIGGTGPIAEACDGLDNNCDGTVDEGNPGGGGSCGTDLGLCTFGTRVCTAGALVCTGGTGAVAEACNALDDDCDGLIDEGDPGGGAACGVTTGTCTAGTQACVGGALSCIGGTGPTAEACDGLDNNCDGSVDEGNPGGGGACGTDVGLCSFGTRVCTAGALACMGGTGPSAEACNALDDDCDTLIDEGNPGGGAACGATTGACTAGTEVCAGGALTCSGGTGPSLELCDGVDNDCNGMTDEGFDLTSDPSNCGMCGNACAGLSNATTACVASSCSLIACDPGWVNLDTVDSNGCEYMCSFAGAEICNGQDDDCDGVDDIAEGLTPPVSFCNPNGVCGGTAAVCGGGSGWTCTYPATYESTETTCDGLDNDCDGFVDEAFPLVGTACSNGELGACLRTGAWSCNAGGDGVECSAPAVGGGTSETCNAIDDDCDGVVDENAPDSWVTFTSGGSTRYVYQYEASRPDATAVAAGSATHRACSVPDRLPWADVTYAQAQAACAASGARLCTETEWEDACRSSTGTCDWSYGASCTTYAGSTCNGNDYDTDTGTAGDQDGTIPTGSLTSCYARWGGGAGPRVYDMSGNVEEWTEARTPGVNPLRGGANNDISGGMTCGFDFVVAGDTVALPTVGFRCCRDTPTHCVSGAFDGDETDVDCGGSCFGCADGRDCSIAGDCLSGVCTGGTCAVPSCTDGIRNGLETDVDCGGATACARCPDFDACSVDSDCVNNCIGGTCRDISCTPFGSDTFGYVGCDTTPGAPTCPDIRGSGTGTGLSDDGSTSVTIPFTFDFYGTGYTTARINANGVLSFGTASSMTFSNSCLPYTTEPTFIAPFWDDLNPSNGGNDVYYETVGSAPNREFVVQWDVEHFSSTPMQSDIRLVLHESTNDITVCYVNTDFGNATYDSGITATSGIQGTATDYLQYSCNTATLVNGLVVDYYHP